MYVIYQGRVLSVLREIGESDDQYQYRLHHSLNVEEYPISTGYKDTYHLYGMQYQQYIGYSPNLSITEITRNVLKDEVFRGMLYKYLMKRYHTNESQISSLISTGTTDNKVREGISRLKSKDTSGRIEDRVHLVMNMLSRIPHVKIHNYLDFGTGDGTIAKNIGDILGANTQGVDIYDMKRDIPTLVIKSGDTLPLSWTNKYDLITVFMALHHVENQQEILKELYRVLSPGGIIIIREHDYIDMTYASSLHKQVSHTDDRQGITTQNHNIVLDTNKYRNFLDAIHIVSLSPEEDTFWALYRAKMEWHHLLLQEGFIHMCTTDKIGTNWLESNPQRVYETIFSKKRIDISTPLILEYKTNRSLSVSTFFPKIGDTIPDVKEGINYNEEILSYMTPWYVAQQTSIMISKIMKEKYGNIQYKIYDGTGGAGGNIISFMNNRDISSINVYEKVPIFFQFLVNNVQLYSGNDKGYQKGNRYTIKREKQDIYISNEEFPLESLTSGDKPYIDRSVLFLDVPWISEGCGYKLKGYKYAGKLLEDVARQVLNAGAYLVVLKLPPNYVLSIQNKIHTFGKESIYVIDRSAIQNRYSTVSHGNTAHEIIRYILMNHLYNEFNRLLPNNNYYAWLYERLRLTTLDPIIPATQYPIKSQVIRIYKHNRNISFIDLSRLIRQSYPSLVSKLGSILPTDTEAINRLIDEIASVENTDDIENELHSLCNTLYNIYIDKSSISDIFAHVTIQKDGSMSIAPNKELTNAINSINVTTDKKYPTTIRASVDRISTLRKRFIGKGFEQAVSSMMIRYMNVPTINPIDMNIQNISMELYTSPYSATLLSYLSMFPDTDRVFGSKGTLYTYRFVSDGSYILMPPTIESISQHMISHIENILYEASNNKIYLSFTILIPTYDISSINMLKHSRWMSSNRIDTSYIAVLKN